MKKSQNYQIQMHFNTQSVCNQNAELLAAIIAYVDAKLKLDNSIAHEQEVAHLQELYKTTSVIPRNLARVAASNSLLDLSSKIMSYSLVKGNMTLYLDVKLTKTAIEKVSDQEFVLIYAKILGAAQDNIEDLADYNVTEQTIAGDIALLENFRNEMQILEDRKSDYAEYTLELDRQIKSTNKDLKPIDSMVNSMRLSQLNLFSKYWDARAVKKAGGAKVAAKGKVYDSVTNQPLPGAVMSIVRTDGMKALSSGADLVKNVKIRAAGGGFQLKSLPTGTYLFKVTYAGYTDHEVTVYINEGVLTQVELPLSKIA